MAAGTNDTNSISEVIAKAATAAARVLPPAA